MDQESNLILAKAIANDLGVGWRPVATSEAAWAQKGAARVEPCEDDKGWVCIVNHDDQRFVGRGESVTRAVKEAKVVMLNHIKNVAAAVEAIL